jgi:hypothetical protein
MNRQAEYGYEKTRPHDDSLADQVADTAKDYAKKAREVGEDAIEVADGYLRPIGLSLREKPMTTLAVFGGIAFVAGAASGCCATPSGNLAWMVCWPSCPTSPVVRARGGRV